MAKLFFLLPLVVIGVLLTGMASATVTAEQEHMSEVYERNAFCLDTSCTLEPAKEAESERDFECEEDFDC
jgi:hypothetical protein